MLIFYLIAISVPVMDCSDVIAGMKGFGITVFEGSNPDTFGVEVIGIRKGIAPGQDIILAKLKGKRIEETGVISGMSGSPVYIDGKLLGAIAYNIGGAFSKEPICGITPIGNILNPPKTCFSDIYIKEEIPIPVSFLNISDAAISLFKREIETLGWQCGVSGSASELSITNYRLPHYEYSPGSPVGVLLVSGDARMGAVGTITHIEGEKLYAFGHRFMGLGKVEFPIATAHIHTVVSSYYSSFRIAEIGNIIGCMDMDAFTGISAVIGKTSTIIDMTVKNGDITYKYKLAKEKRLFPLLVNFMLASSIFTSYARGNVTYFSVCNIDTKDGEIRLSDTYSGDVMDVIRAMTGDINLILENDYSKLDIESLTFDLTPLYEVKIARINDIQGEIRDDTLILICTLTPYREKPLRIEERIPIRNSDGRKPLRVSISGCDAMKTRMWDEVTDFDEFIRYLENRPKRTSIVIQVFTQNNNYLPPSYSEFMKDGEKPQYEKVIDTEWVILGGASCEIQ